MTAPIRAIIIGMPLFRVSTRPISSTLASSASASFQRSLARSVPFIAGQAPLSKALRAAFTALSMSAAVPAWILAMT